MEQRMNEQKQEYKILFESRGCRKILAKNPSLKKKISEGLIRQAENGFFKTKAATRTRWKGQPVYEFRVNDPALKAVRVAFTAFHHEMHVVYITTSIQKSEFSKEIDAFLKEES